MSIDLQFVAVLVVVGVAAAYAGRSFLRQFRTGDDEAEGCATCDSNEEAQPGPTPRPTLVVLSRTTSAKPASPS